MESVNFILEETGKLDLTLDLAKFHVLPSALFMQQAKADQLNTGIGFGYDFTEDANMTLGIYNRANNISNKYATIGCYYSIRRI
jgi:hypothetical protein